MRLFCDCKTDEEKSNFFLSGRAVETGVIAPAISNEVAMAYYRCAQLKKENDALQAKVEAMEKQEPVAFVDYKLGNCFRWAEYLGWQKIKDGSKLYALPGAQPAPSVPEDVMRDAERYRYLRARDEGTAGVGCWIEADGRACDRGWLYGDQLDSAIDTCIEMLAAAPEAKP